jgi:DNA replication protein DnaC
MSSRGGLRSIRHSRRCFTASKPIDYPRYLLRLAELELLDRERRATERRIRQAKFPVKMCHSMFGSTIPVTFPFS